MVSVEQIAALIDRMEDHPEVALAQSNRSKEGRDFAKRFWLDTAKILNKVSADCTTKSCDQWRLYYNEYKSKVLKKVKIEKAKTMAAGGGICKIPLTPLQKRLYSILKRDVRESAPAVQDPLFQYKVLKSEVPEDAPTEENTQLADDGQNGSGEQPSQGNPVPSCSTRWETTVLIPAKKEQEPDRGSLAEEGGARGRAAPRRRRRVPFDAAEHKRAMRDVSDHYRARQEASEECSMRDATRRLEAMERLSAAATRAHAQATNRLAAALEVLADRLRDPIVIVRQRPGEAERRAKRSSRQSSSGSD